jgi:hypothetical protein
VRSAGSKSLYFIVISTSLNGLAPARDVFERNLQDERYNLDLAKLGASCALHPAQMPALHIRPIQGR